MTENQAPAQQQEEYIYGIRIEDAGPATKKVFVEIPQERISTKLEEQFKELRKEAAVPGFRPGHAPKKLIEKRFHNDVREQVRRALISESYEQAVAKNSLNVIGEPEFDNPDAIQLPADGSLSYSFQIEVQPDIALPPLTGLKVRKPKVEVREEHVDQAMLNLREQQGVLVPVEGRGVGQNDRLIADVHFQVDGNELAHHHDLEIVSRPGRIAGIPVNDLDSRLSGMLPGESRQFTVTAPDKAVSEAIRGKQVVIDVNLKELKRMEMAEITQEFLDGLGFATAEELRQALKEQMLERVDYDVKQAMRQQVNDYLLENVQFDLPTRLSERQTSRVVQRRQIDLLMRGMPQEQVTAQADDLRGGAHDEAARELKLFFILQKVATDQNVDVSEGELNGRIALIAAQQGKRPEKVKQEMAADGSLINMYVQMREQKAVDNILRDAQVEEIDLSPIPEGSVVMTGDQPVAASPLEPGGATIIAPPETTEPAPQEKPPSEP